MSLDFLYHSKCLFYLRQQESKRLLIFNTWEAPCNIIQGWLDPLPPLQGWRLQMPPENGWVSSPGEVSLGPLWTKTSSLCMSLIPHGSLHFCNKDIFQGVLTPIRSPLPPIGSSSCSLTPKANCYQFVN